MMSYAWKNISIGGEKHEIRMLVFNTEHDHVKREICAFGRLFCERGTVSFVIFFPFLAIQNRFWSNWSFLNRQIWNPNFASGLASNLRIFRFRRPVTIYASFYQAFNRLIRFSFSITWNLQLWTSWTNNPTDFNLPRPPFAIISEVKLLANEKCQTKRIWMCIYRVEPSCPPWEYR